jgi:hypothetical protein
MEANMSDQKADLRMKLTASRQEMLALMGGLDEAAWGTAVFAEDASWSVLDLLRHVTDAENSMTALMARIRDGGEGVPEDFDLDRWNASRLKKIQTKTPTDLVADMQQNRTNLFAFMESLTEEDWQKKGRHGSGRIMTIEEICHIIADHERLHAADIRAALGK